MGFLPEADLEYLDSKGIVFQEVEHNGTKGVILKDRPLPQGRFDTIKVDVLILLPNGYPDLAPDMFYLLPWVKLTASKTYPSKADHPLEFGGQKWQRWSRHNPDWRPGVDGLRTMIKRVEDAFEKAVA